MGQAPGSPHSAVREAPWRGIVILPNAANSRTCPEAGVWSLSTAKIHTTDTALDSRQKVL